MMKSFGVQKVHEPVLLDEVLKAFEIDKLAHLKRPIKILDATVGLGGHTEALVKSGVEVLGIDADKSTLEVAREHLTKACPPNLSTKVGSYTLVHGNFRNLEEIAKAHNFVDIDGVLFDLGVSSLQLTSPERGFSFQNESVDLDMRLDKANQSVKGADLLNFLRKDQLTELFQRVLPKVLAKKLSEAIVGERKTHEIRSVGDFLKAIKRVIKFQGKLNLATLPFLALRIAVNSEIENLEEGLPKALNILTKGGKLVLISFHSGEDRVVKNFLKSSQTKGIGKIITDKVIRPKSEEIIKNPRARSAKMRILEKT